MRAVGLTEFGGPEVLSIVEKSPVEPGPGTLRIRVAAATINPADSGFVAGGLKGALERTEPPYVPGMEAAGVVEALGDGVDDLFVGDRVMAVVLPFGRYGGAQKELLVVKRESVMRTPDHLSDVEAATLPMNGLTALVALDVLDLARGDWLWVTGAPGALGGYVVELGKARGLNIVVDVADKDHELVRRLGADVLVERGDGVGLRVIQAVPGGVAGVLDAALLEAEVLPAVRTGGSVVAIRPTSLESADGVEVHLVMVGEHARDAGAVKRLEVAAEERILSPRIAEVFPASRAQDAYRLAQGGGLRGRVVLTFGE